MSAVTDDIARYALYGDQDASVFPEFLHIEDIPSRSALYDWVIAPHTHPGIFQLLLVTQGTVRTDLDGAVSDHAAPALICVPGNCIHAFSFSAGTQGWVLSIAQDLLRDVRLASFADGLARCAASGRVVALTQAPHSFARLDWLLTDMAARMVSEQGRVPDLVVILLAAVLGVVLECAWPAGPVPAAKDRRAELVRAFEQLVDHHYREHLSVADYAAALAVASPTLNRACRAILGKSPGDILLDRLLLEAMRYLRHTAASAKQIAGRLGFDDPGYFARFFKKRSGMTTRQFRQGLSQRAGDTLSTSARFADSEGA